MSRPHAVKWAPVLLGLLVGADMISVFLRCVAGRRYLLPRGVLRLLSRVGSFCRGGCRVRGIPTGAAAGPFLLCVDFLLEVDDLGLQRDHFLVGFRWILPFTGFSHEVVLV